MLTTKMGELCPQLHEIQKNYEAQCGLEVAEAAWTAEAIEASFGELARTQLYAHREVRRQRTVLAERRARRQAWLARHDGKPLTREAISQIIDRINGSQNNEPAKPAKPVDGSRRFTYVVNNLRKQLAAHIGARDLAQRLMNEAEAIMAQTVMNGWDEAIDGSLPLAYFSATTQAAYNAKRVASENKEIALLEAAISAIETAIGNGEEPIRRAGWAPEVDKKTYAVFTFGLPDLMGPDFMRALEPAFEVMKAEERPKGWMRTVDGAIRTARAIVAARTAEKWRSKLNSRELSRNALTQSAATDAATALKRNVEQTFAIGKLGLAKELRKLEYSNQYASNLDEIRNLVEAINEYAQTVGVSVDGLTYVLLCSTPGQAKVGDAYFAETGFLRETWKDFWSYGQKFADFRSNGTEEMKRMALLFTPSVEAIGQHNTRLRVNQILMLDEIGTRQMLDSLWALAKTSTEFQTFTGMKKKVTRWDGALFLLTQVFGAGFQFRSHGALALKGLAVNAMSALAAFVKQHGRSSLPDTMADICGQIWAFPWSSDETKRKYPVALAITTTSVWKGKSLGLTWSEAVARTVALEQRFKGAANLRAIRYIDAETDSQRKLGRQILQQMLGFWRTPKAVSKLTDGAIRNQLNKRTLSATLAELAELDRPEETRTEFAKLVARKPELLLTDAVQAFLKKRAITKAKWLASGKLPIDGSYPYIVEDPLAFFEVIFLGKDPQDPMIGALRANECSAAEYADGTELFACRMPANWLVSLVLTNRVSNVFSSLGACCVLSEHDAALVVFDGDTDGDEVFLSPSELLIDMIKKARAIGVDSEFAKLPVELRTPVLAFEHPDGPAKKGFDSPDERRHAIAVALTNTAYHNDVGRYSNGAAAYLAAASKALAKGDKATFADCMRSAAWLSIAAILVIDAAKNGDMPENIASVVENLLDKKVAPSMPWNQRFNKGWTEAEFQDDQERYKPSLIGEPQTGYLPDEVANRVWNALKNWTFDAEGVELPDDFIQDLLIDDGEAKSMNAVVASGFVQTIFETVWKKDEETDKILEAVKAGKPIGLKKLVLYFWRNESAMKYKMSVSDELDEVRQNEARLEAYHELVRRTVVNAAYNAYGAMGVKRVVNYLVSDALNIAHNYVGQATDPEKVLEEKGSYAVFILQVFAAELNHPEWVVDSIIWEELANDSDHTDDPVLFPTADEDYEPDYEPTEEDWEALAAQMNDHCTGE